NRGRHGLRGARRHHGIDHRGGRLTLQYTDATAANFAGPVTGAGSFTPMPVTGYFAGPAQGHMSIAGLTYGTVASGIAPDGSIGPTLYPGVNAYVFTDGNGNVLYQPTTGLAPGFGQAITAGEAQLLMTSAQSRLFGPRGNTQSARQLRASERDDRG